MGKKMMTGMIVLAFICSSFLLMTSCAKKVLFADDILCKKTDSGI
jgi:hypothetical protein